MPDVRTYLIALGVGLLIGAIYGLLDVRSPAPPVVALVGLLGILLGEQIVPLARHLLERNPVTAAAGEDVRSNHVVGTLPVSHQEHSS